MPASGPTRPAIPTAPYRDDGRAGAALLIIDMINRFAFTNADALRDRAQRAAEAIVTLKAIARRAGMPIIYINDNFGEWHSEKSMLVERAMEGGNAVTEMLLPDEADYFIIKPQFSGFYATNLPVLLPKLGVGRLIITGIATDICVLFTAADAHMRDYTMWVPEDAVASADERGDWALEIMRNGMRAETRATTDLAPSEWLASVDAESRGETSSD